MVFRDTSYDLHPRLESRRPVVGVVRWCLHEIAMRLALEGLGRGAGTRPFFFVLRVEEFLAEPGRKGQGRRAQQRQDAPGQLRPQTVPVWPAWCR